MNKDRFIALVKNPALLKAEDAPFLEELLKEFPYFQSAHLLAARCYKVSDSIHLQKQIKKAAAHITDRRVLYNLIENFKADIPEAFPAKTQEVMGNEIEEGNNSVIVNQPVKESPEELAVNLSPAEDKELMVDAAPAIEVTGITDELIETPAVLETNTETEINVAENNDYTVEAEVIPEKEDVTSTIIASQFEAEIPLENEIKLALAESLYLKELEQISAEKQEVVAETAPLLHEKEEIASKIDEKEKIQVENTADQQNNEAQTAFVAWLKNLQIAPKEPEKNTENIAVKEGEKLIDAFIEKPIQRAKPIKQEFYSPVNMAKQSVTDNDFFVTETLAKIYIKQGNLTKAIKVYQNLSLKNPEKNTFFAAQIKILKEQLHNKSGK